MCHIVNCFSVSLQYINTSRILDNTAKTITYQQCKYCKASRSKCTPESAIIAHMPHLYTEHSSMQPAKCFRQTCSACQRCPIVPYLDIQRYSKWLKRRALILRDPKCTVLKLLSSAAGVKGNYFLNNEMKGTRLIQWGLIDLFTYFTTIYPPHYFTLQSTKWLDEIRRTKMYGENLYSAI
jgi:hypothetical protein